MTQMGRYCKAYPADRFTAFTGWPGVSPIARTEVTEDGAADDILYLHDNFTVTRGVFLDEDVVFAQGGAEWEAFCKTALEFDVPDFARDAE